MKDSLHEYEKKIIIALGAGKLTQKQLVSKAGLPDASVAHAGLWLFSKKIVTIDERREEFVELNREGKGYLEQGLPERRALDLLGKGTLTIAQLERGLGKPVARIALTWLMREGSATIKGGTITLSAAGRKSLSSKTGFEKALQDVSKRVPISGLSKGTLKLLESRGKIVKKTEEVTRTVSLTAKGKALLKSGMDLGKEVNVLSGRMITTGGWKKEKFRQYDITSPVPTVYPGKRHFVKQAGEYVRRIWLEMGFKEMRGPLIDTSFWNFDALFTPQNHPVREMQDTFYVEPSAGELPPKRLVDTVKRYHERGSKDSLGWRYEWDADVAKKRVLRTHTTILSARTLAQLKKDDWPAKYFAIGRCFRNEAMDWSHLFEFNQFEGIVVDENANFRHLLGYLREFFKKLGFERARFRPAYFPYTEMSIEIDVFHSGHGKWIELGGAGIFRPEVVEPLLGQDVPVLAWGPGFDRIIMDYYSIGDIRELYKNDIMQMRKSKQWMW